jgi:hypothetical protein
MTAPVEVVESAVHPIAAGVIQAVVVGIDVTGKYTAYNKRHPMGAAFCMKFSEDRALPI